MEAKPMAFPEEAEVSERFDRVPSLGEIGLDHFAPYLINRISARWNTDLGGQIKEHGLTTLQMRVLAILTVMAGSTVNEVAVFAVTEQSTMSRTLDGMERDGLVRRKNRRGDARVRELHLTEKGREAFRDVWPVMYESLKRMFAGFSDAEYETLIGLLTRVLRNVRRHDF